MRILSAFASMFLMALTASAAKAERRVAFVVGNGTYKNVAPLPNPSIDAKAMAGVLRNVGFEVVEGTNLTRDKMTEKLLEFGKKAQGADVAVFFYAGHGIAISGTNYLLPIDADIKSEMDVKLGRRHQYRPHARPDHGRRQGQAGVPRCLPRQSVRRQDQVERGDPQRQCADRPCRDEVRRRHADRVRDRPGQTALDGQEGANSPFTRALIANIAQPGIEIQQAMTKVRAQVNEETNKGQLPWGHTNLIGTVYLNGAPAPAANAGVAAAGIAAVAAAPSADVELEFWRSIKDSNKPEELNAYLTNYPNGQFRSLALARIAALENGASTATRNLTTGIDPATFTAEANQTTEDQIGLDKGQRRDVQRRLTGLGFDTKVTGSVRRGDPRGDHALAGRARLSQERLPQQAAAQGAADRDRGDHAVGEFAATRTTPCPPPRQQQRWRRQPTAAQPRPQPQPQAQPHYSSSGPDPAGAGRFVGGVVGGMLGGAFRR